MIHSLKGQTALVTGGAVRIGRAICLQLAEQGCNLAIHYGHSEQAAQDLARTLTEKYPIKASIFQADLSKAESCDHLIDQILTSIPQLDILVNNAAIFPEPDEFKNINQDTWQKLMDINLRAPLFLSHAFAQQQQPGSIINIIDARYQKTGTDHFMYRLGKHGLAELTRMLALELAPQIRVNAIAPGAILPPPGKGTDFLERNKRKLVPLNSIGNAEHIANNVIHLLKQEFMTGQIISIDGGEFI